MVTLTTLLDRIRTRYEAESGGSAVRWPDADITLAINEGIETLAEAAGFYERYVTVPLRAGATYYDLRGFTPDVVVLITSVWSEPRTDWLTPVSPFDLDISRRQQVGDPLSYFPRGIHWVGINPIPSAAAGNLRVHFVGIPPRLSSPSATVAELADSWTVALEDYALYEMAAQDRQPKRALLHWASYSKRETALTSRLSNRNAAPRHGAIGGQNGVL